MLVDNRKIVKEVNIEVFNELLEVEVNLEAHLVIEPAKREGETLALIMDGSPVYMTSKYNPINEAQTIVNQFNEQNEPKHFLFIGTALGYHIVELLKRFPNATYSIYEPNIYILAAFLEKQNLARLKAKLVQIFTSKEQIHDFQLFAVRHISQGEIVRWTVTSKLYEEEIYYLDEAIKKALKDEKFSLGVNASHQRRWQENAIINFPKILKTPYLFDFDTTRLENKPVIIVAAGPSLSMDMDFIKEIKDKKKAYIFAVGSAINALIEYGIMPDAFVSFDPQVINQNVVLKVKENNLSVPMFFGSTIGHETLPNYPGPMFHFFVREETISRYLLDLQPEQILLDKPSVAVMAFEICVKFKMGPIILAGQNCAYLDNKRYANGIEYTHISSDISEKEERIEVESVDGETVYTSSAYLIIKKAFEQYIRGYQVENVYNTTQRGANIEGATYVKLEELLATLLREDNVATFDWQVPANNYNLVVIQQRYILLEKSCEELLYHVKQIDNVIAAMIEKSNSKIYTNIGQLLVQYDRQFDAIHANTFYKVVIEPMIRVNRQKFLKHSHEVMQATNPKLKTEKFMRIHVPYIRAIVANLYYIQDAFKEIKQIKEWDEL